MIIHLKNNLGLVKKCPLGFCWSALLLGFIIPFSRQDIKWGLLSLVLFILLLDSLNQFSIAPARAIIIGGIYFILFPLLYNRFYITSLLNKGFEPADKESYEILKNNDMISSNAVFNDDISKS